MLSGRSGETDRIVGLDLGADDYLIKPFSPGELAARIRSVLRRSSPELTDEASARRPCGSSRHPAGPLGGAEVDLTPKEFDLLVFLAAHPRDVFTRSQLSTRCGTPPRDWLGEATVTEHVHRLRPKLEPDPSHPRLLRTVRGVGYQLMRPVSAPVRGPPASRGGLCPGRPGMLDRQTEVLELIAGAAPQHDVLDESSPPWSS